MPGSPDYQIYHTLPQIPNIGSEEQIHYAIDSQVLSSILKSMKRHVPLKVRLRVLSGGFSFFFGLMFLLGPGIGLAFMLPMVDWQSFRFNNEADVRLAQGRLYKISATGTEVNDRRIYAYHYTYSPNGDGILSNVSYAPRIAIEVPDQVDVEYLASKPAISRIRGMGGGSLPPFFLFFMLPFLLVGGGFLGKGIVKGVRANRLLAVGELTRGVLVNKKATNTTINEERVYAYEFEFQAKGQTFRAKGRTRFTHLVEDEEQELIVYDPHNPQQALIVDTLPRAATEFLSKQGAQ